MKEKGYLIRTTDSSLPAALNDCIRITLGPPDQIKNFISEFKKVI